MAQPLPTAWFNGYFMPLNQVRISPLDRGFLFADGVYEVVPVYAGQPFELEAHLDRLAYSLAGIRLDNPLSRAAWRDMVTELVAHNGGGDQTVYCQVTRGAPGERDHGFPSQPVPATCFAMASPLSPQPERIRQQGASAVLAADERWARCDIKSISLLPNVLAKQQARDQGADEAIFHRDGDLVEGSSTSLFLVVDDALLTPPKSHAILPGITRDVVIELARTAGIEVRETPIARGWLDQASELWLSSSSREIVPVTRVDGQAVGFGDQAGRPGPLWARMQAALIQRTRKTHS